MPTKAVTSAAAAVISAPVTSPGIARRGVESSRHLGSYRWVVERTFAWINQFRRLVVRYERHADLYRAFLVVAAGIICLRVLAPEFCWVL